MKKQRKIIITLLATCALSGCGSLDRLQKVGEAPEMTKIENPQLQEGYQPISMPMPAPQAVLRQPNSLWDSSRQTFFKDQRARAVGDILTVMIDISDDAKMENETERTRESSENAGMDNLLGYEDSLNRVLPQAVDNENLAGFEADSGHKGKGTVDRKEDIAVRVAAVITQILPNGNLVIHGRQEARVNFEKRIVQVDGIVRPQDVSTGNTVSHDQIAEARIVYGGEGQLTDVQQPRYGQQVYDVLFPF